MMAERAAFRAHRRTRPAIEIELEHLRLLGIGKEAERLDGRSEERDDARADAGGHVHHAGVARDEHRGTGETRARLLQRELSCRVVHAGTELAGELPVARAADGDESVSHTAQLLRERAPVAERPALGRVRDRKSTRLNSSHVAISYA